ncbi:hypothetical protein [Rhizobium sp. S163]|uniref:hypothetical protein n=1 Tax=Rhizobium sp. S163 TaxID=3055039 RepID=UPI0025A9C7ED|nr:hypothetical protein [Rhizobium sp. S163]MDM9647717.1 hypothetical protein [Rhizobium sp. S163]
MMAKVSLSSQIEAIDAFLQRGNRAAVFPGAKGDLHRDHMRAVGETLRWVQRNEPDIRDFIAEKKASRA